MFNIESSSSKSSRWIVFWWIDFVSSNSDASSVRIEQLSSSWLFGRTLKSNQKNKSMIITHNFDLNLLSRSIEFWSILIAEDGSNNNEILLIHVKENMKIIYRPGTMFSLFQIVCCVLLIIMRIIRKSWWQDWRENSLMRCTFSKRIFRWNQFRILFF